MKKVEVKPCANGTLCKVDYDERDETFVIYDQCGTALGYFEHKNRWHDLTRNPDDLPIIMYENGDTFYMLNTEMLITCKIESREPWVRKAKLLYEDGTYTPCEGKKVAWFNVEYPSFGGKIDKWFDEKIEITAWKYINLFTEEPFIGGE